MIKKPPLNTAFIVSTCCVHCISEIQKSFKNADNKYSIRYEDEMYKLYHNNEEKQIVLECTTRNMEKVLELAGTQLMENIENNYLNKKIYY